MLPLIGTATQHQSILLPDTAPGQIESRILERLSEIQTFRVCVEDVDGTIIRQMTVHLLKRCQQELVEF